MNETAQEIVNWLHQQQDWLQAIAEHVLTGGKPSDSDVKRFVSHLKSEAGRTVTTSRRFEPLNESPVACSELRLRSLGNIKGIENLAPDRPLEFGSGNLVVVYGPNGSGKSGYTRILSRACGKPTSQPLGPNVFRPPPPERTCTIGYRIGMVDRDVTWDPDNDAIAELRLVDFFDASAASAYLCDETESTYTPPLLTLFEEIAQCCNRIKGNLEVERAQLVKALPALPSLFAGTTAARSYQQLSDSTSAEVISALIEWTSEDQVVLDKLSERVKAKDAAAIAKQKRATKLQVERLISELESAGSTLSAQQLHVLRVARKSARGKRRVAVQAAKACSQSSKLEGIGTDSWSAMWEAARKYSQIPYPDHDFPVTTPGSRCLLCHQTLQDDARQRLRDFETYVQGIVESEALTAEREYANLLDSLPVAPARNDFHSRCEATGVMLDRHHHEADRFWSDVRQAVKSLKDHERRGKAKSVTLPVNLIKDLRAKSVSLEQDAKKYDRDAKSTNRALLLRQKVELEARKWISQQAQAIRTEVARLKKISSLEGLMALTNSRPISLKASNIADKIITEAYITRFNDELRSLGAERISVELIKSRTMRGRAMHKLVLKGAMQSRSTPESILSEGERRVVSLAAFLADVSEKPYPAPFVFDDPISSLDSDFEWNVAERLAKLARKRQVLVFTHRLSLYGAMEDAANNQGETWCKTQLVQRYIESFGGTSGHPAAEQIWNANTKKANNLLLARLDDAVKAGEAGGADAYRLHARGICADFRVLLERTIEDDLLNRVVRRHRRSLTTDNRIEKLSCIGRKDCDYFDKLMTKYSCYEHSQSSEAPVFIPEERELRTDLVSLKNWRDEFQKRANGDA